MARRNRVDPWGDLFSVPERGMFTGNRGCLLDDDGAGPVRHHNGSLWIICQLQFRGWRHPLDAPRTWTPLFFLDDAVALAAGHRPCGLCRRDAYLAYQRGVGLASSADGPDLDPKFDHRVADRPVLAPELNRRLAAERLRRGRGLSRAGDRQPWRADLTTLPTGTVVINPKTGDPALLTDHYLQPFDFSGWGPSTRTSGRTDVEVLTPPTSVDALRNGFEPTLHPSARH